MTRLLLAAAAALGLMAGIAMAQTSATMARTTPGAMTPPGTLSTNVTKESVGPDGSIGYSQSTTYDNGAGGTTTETTATTYPAPPPPPHS